MEPNEETHNREQAEIMPGECLPQGKETLFRPPLRRIVIVGILFLFVVALIASALAGAVLYLDTRVFQPVGTISEDAAYSAKWGTILPGLPLFLVAQSARTVILICLIAGVLMVPVVMRTKRFHTPLAALIFVAMAFGEVILIRHGETELFRRYFRETFAATAERAQPLIDAIEKYHQSNGEYPPDLESLVPDLLSEIPHTDLAGYPRFEYMLPADENDAFDDYQLMIRTPIGGINWDVFVYWPSGNYPEYFYGGGSELFGDWAYVHE